MKKWSYVKDRYKFKKVYNFSPNKKIGFDYRLTKVMKNNIKSFILFVFYLRS